MSLRNYFGGPRPFGCPVAVIAAFLVFYGIIMANNLYAFIYLDSTLGGFLTAVVLHTGGGVLWLGFCSAFICPKLDATWQETWDAMFGSVRKVPRDKIVRNPNEAWYANDQSDDKR